MSEDQSNTRPDLLPHAEDEPLAEVSPVTSTWHHPGEPLETQADRDAQVDDLQLREGDAATPTEYEGLDTSHPELNYATRSNIEPPTPAPNPDVVMDVVRELDSPAEDA